ncbi:hypothetical protein T09_3449, partial [Trichinella sp. T9]
LPVVLGASHSSPTTPEFVGAQGQHPATPGSARLVGTGRQRSGVVVQAGGQLRIHTLPAAPASGLPALQVPGSS